MVDHTCSVTCHYLAGLICTAWWQRHKVIASPLPQWESNPRPLDRWSDAVPVALPRHPWCCSVHVPELKYKHKQHNSVSYVFECRAWNCDSFVMLNCQLSWGHVRLWNKRRQINSYWLQLYNVYCLLLTSRADMVTVYSLKFWSEVGLSFKILPEGYSIDCKHAQNI